MGFLLGLEYQAIKGHVFMRQQPIRPIHTRLIKKERLLQLLLLLNLIQGIILQNRLKRGLIHKRRKLAPAKFKVNTDNTGQIAPNLSNQALLLDLQCIWLCRIKGEVLKS